MAKKDIETNIKKTKNDIIDKKVSLYELRTQLPAKDPYAISVKTDSIGLQNTVKTYDTLIENQYKIDNNKELLNLYKGKRDTLLKKIKLEKVKIFEQAELLQKEKLPFDLTLEEQLNTAKNPLIEQKINVNNKLKRLWVNEKSKKAFANTRAVYKATIYNTNFTVPVARFNFGDEDNNEGNVILFNSIGAGFGMSWGKLEEVRNGAGDLVATDFRNSISLHAGVLFSASSGENGNNVFAPVVSLGLLDFQLGLGYELGTLSEDQDPFFLTIGYAIPLYKLTKTKFYVKKKSKILNEITAF